MLALFEKSVALFGAVEADPLNALAVDLNAKAFQLFLVALPVR
jgi:hypothetical protein